MANYQPKPRGYTPEEEQSSAIETQTPFEDTPLAEVIDLDEARERLRGLDISAINLEPSLEQPAPMSELERTKANTEIFRQSGRNVTTMRHYAVIDGKVPAKIELKRAV